MAKFWTIRGYDSEELILERRIPEDAVSEDDIMALLRSLAASHLEPGEAGNGMGLLGLRRERAGLIHTTGGFGGTYTAQLE